MGKKNIFFRTERVVLFINYTYKNKIQYIELINKINENVIKQK